MRKVFLIFAMLFTVLGVVLAIFPLGTIPLLPVVLALLFGFLAFRKSNIKQKLIPKILLLIAALTLLVVLGKEIFVKNEVAKDLKFEQIKTESNEEDLNDLEGLQ